METYRLGVGNHLAESSWSRTKAEKCDASVHGDDANASDVFLSRRVSSIRSSGRSVGLPRGLALPRHLRSPRCDKITIAARCCHSCFVFGFHRSADFMCDVHTLTRCFVSRLFVRPLAYLLPQRLCERLLARPYFAMPRKPYITIYRPLSIRLEQPPSPTPSPTEYIAAMRLDLSPPADSLGATVNSDSIHVPSTGLPTAASVAAPPGPGLPNPNLSGSNTSSNIPGPNIPSQSVTPNVPMMVHPNQRFDGAPQPEI